MNRGIGAVHGTTFQAVSPIYCVDNQRSIHGQSMTCMLSLFFTLFFCLIIYSDIYCVINRISFKLNSVTYPRGLIDSFIFNSKYLSLST